MGDLERVSFIDPAIGTGSFFSALLAEFPAEVLDCAVGYEIDPHYGEAAARLWKDTPLEVRQEDFTLAAPPPAGQGFNLLICNPPYVRHHHMDSARKRQLKELSRAASGIDISGLAGLYCYFLALSHRWLRDGGLACWLIPSEFMDVNYGGSLKHYLLDTVTLEHVHRFDPKDVQFDDALVSSSVVWLRKQDPPVHHHVRMSFGDSLLSPRLERPIPADTLRRDPKWTHYPMRDRGYESSGPILDDFFRIKRGLVTGSNRFFILTATEIEDRCLPIEAFRPILPSPRFLADDEIHADDAGNPLLGQPLFLLDCPWTEEVIENLYPSLMAYIDEGKARGVPDGYICRHRAPWYSQECRPAAPYMCTYLGRSDKSSGRPFRFFLNHSIATAPNVYLMLYPRASLSTAIDQSPELKRQVWNFLNCIAAEELLGEGRVYGGGLHKLEPRELGRVPAVALADLVAELGIRQDGRQLVLLEGERRH